MRSLLKKYKNLIVFLVGFGLFAFTRVSTFVPIAIVIAPIFILYLSRSNKTAKSILLTIFGMVIAMQIALYGFSPSDLDILVIANFVRNIVLGLVLSLPYILDRLLVKRITGYISTLIFPISAVTVYFLNSIFGPFSGTGIFYAYTQYGNLALNQLISVFGIWGLVFLLSWISSTFVWMVENGFRWDNIKKGVIITFSVLFIALFFGGLKASPLFFEYEGETTRVAAVVFEKNTNDEDIRDVLDKRMYTPFDETIEKIEDKIKTAKNSGSDFVVFQEFSMIIPEEQESELKDKLMELSSSYDIYTCFSYVIFPKLLDGEHEKDFLGHTILSDEEEEGYNKALLINPQGNIEIEYNKHNLAQGEGTWVLEGTGGIQVVDTPHGKVGVVICKDMSFPRDMREAGVKNADIVLAPSYELRKSLAITYSQMQRAIENGFSFVRPVYYGLSIAIDYNGRVLSSMNNFTTNNEIMFADVPVKSIKTVYSIIGDLFAWVCVAGFIIIVFYSIRRKRGNNKN